MTKEIKAWLAIALTAAVIVLGVWSQQKDNCKAATEESPGQWTCDEWRR